MARASISTRSRLPGDDTDYLLLPHCTERTTAASTLRDWQTVFVRVGLKLTVLPSGCCGMAGTYGHEAEHRATSERIYALSWAGHVARAGRPAGCSPPAIRAAPRWQLIDGVALRHPIQALLSHLRAGVASEIAPERRDMERLG